MVGLLVSWIQLLDSAGISHTQSTPEASEFQLVAVRCFLDVTHL